VAFRDGDREKRKQVQRELRRSLKQAKEEYKKKVERKLQHNNTRELWRGMRTITGYKQKSGQEIAGGVDKANEFNHFYNRFDTAASVPSAPAGTVSPVLSSTSLAAASPPHHLSPTAAAPTLLLQLLSHLGPPCPSQ